MTRISNWLEFINGVGTIVFTGLVIFLGAYLVRTYARKRSRIFGSSEFKLGWALAVLVGGDALIKGTVWYSRHLVNGGLPESQSWPLTFTIITAVGTAISAWGGICALRMATPARSGEWPWVFVLVTALLVSVLLTWAVPMTAAALPR